MEKQMELTLDKTNLKTILPGVATFWRLRDINVTWRSGERIGLLGRNGSGKTSLSRLIAGLERQSSGQVKRFEKCHITIVLQRPEEHFQYETVGKQIHAYGRSITYSRVIELLDQVGLPQKIIHTPPLLLSTGQQRLVAIACALSSGSKYVVLDEPMAGLDARGRHLVRNSMINLQRQGDISWLIVSHHPDDLFGLVEKLWIMDQGKIIFDGLFRNAPVDILEFCLDKKSISLFYRMRCVESRGLRLPNEMYIEPDLVLLSKLLNETGMDI